MDTTAAHMDVDIVQKSKSLAVAMGRLTAVLDGMKPANADAFDRIVCKLGYFNVVHETFVALTGDREQAVQARQDELQQALTQCETRAAAADRLADEARAKMASLEKLENEVQAKAASLEKLEHEVQLKLDSLDVWANTRAARDSELDERAADLTKRVAELDAMRSDLDRRVAAVESRENGLLQNGAELDKKSTEHDEAVSALDRRVAAVEARETSLSLSEAERLAELDRRTAVVESRESSFLQTEAELGKRVSDADRRTAAIEARETRLSLSESALDKRTDDLDLRTAAVEFRETRLRNDQRALEESAERRKTGLAAAEAAAKERQSALETREAAVQEEAARHADMERGLARKQADLQTKSTELDKAQDSSARQRVELANERIALWVARDGVAKDLSALEGLKRTFDQAQKIALDRASAVDAKLTGQIEKLCESLAACSTESLEPHVASVAKSNSALADGVEGLRTAIHAGIAEAEATLRRLEDRVAALASQLAKVEGTDCSAALERLELAVRGAGRESAELARLRSSVDALKDPAHETKVVLAAIEAAVERIKEGASIVAADAPVADSSSAPSGSRKRCRVESPESGEWEQLISTVALEMKSIVPEPAQPGDPDAATIYYELSILGLRPVYRARWDAFVESGDADIWHCLHSVFAASHSPIQSDGRCERHGIESCLRVMLRREGGAVRTVFAQPR